MPWFTGSFLSCIETLMRVVYAFASREALLIDRIVFYTCIFTKQYSTMYQVQTKVQCRTQGSNRGGVRLQ